MHQTVLLQEAVDAMALKDGGVYVDGTFGRGGHSKCILENMGKHSRLFVFDKDPEAIAVAEGLAASDKRIHVLHGSFSELERSMSEHGVLGKVDAVLLDLGLSSPQLDQGERGFSFMKKGPLDMRMNNESGKSAAEWLREVEESELARVLRTFGEERYAKRVARAIVEAGISQAITDTESLAEIVAQAIPRWEKHKHPATRTFQAIRIVINGELEDLQAFLDQVLRVLKSGGRLVVISFHSLEDRMVKHWMQAMEKGADIPSYIPITDDQRERKVKIIGKAVKPSEDEIARNSRARSAIMRVAEKL